MKTRHTISAYLIIYNDHDILPNTLRAIGPYIDELVVVDGAYEWMLPYLEIIGKMPARSDASVYEALEASGIRYRVVSGIWKNEAEKRIAGYDACTGRYGFRIDADEVPFFYDAELEKFLSSGQSIAEMYKPSYITPGWVLARRGRLPAEPLIFDRSRVEPDVHLNYLWLILGPDQLPKAERKPFKVYEQQIGINAHLNEWRSLDAQIARASFYRLLMMRKYGVAWIPELRGKPLTDLKKLFDVTPPEIFRQCIASTFLLKQSARMDDSSASRSPLNKRQESAFVEHFSRRQQDRVDLNKTIADIGLTFWTGMPIVVDLSSPACTHALVAADAITMSVTCPLSGAAAKLQFLLDRPPWHLSRELDCACDGSSVTISLPPDATALQQYLRCELDIYLSPNSSEPLQRVRVIR